MKKALNKKYKNYIAIFALITLGYLNVHAVYAQSLPSRSELEAKLKAIEAEIVTHKNNIVQKQQEAVGLSRDVNILGSKISQSQAKIKMQSIKINNLTGDISEKISTIQELTYKTDQQKKSLAQIIRKKNELDGASFVEFAFSNKTLSDFFGDDDSYSAVQQALGDSYKELSDAKTKTEVVKESLEEKKDEELSLKQQQEIEKAKTLAAQNEKARILKITKGQEANYKKVLSEREKDAGKIRSALFTLANGSSIQFGTLYDFAKRTQASTGVQAAFIMAIMSQETNLGTNTGQCYMRDEGGTLVSISSGAERGTMRPNSIAPFLTITKALGRDTFKTKVSCAYQGYGGAMGIAQFMPATWASYKSRIENATGGGYADPWNNYHAVTAIGIFLADLGGSGSNNESQRNAACKYYSGRSCASGVGSAYGNTVLRKMADVQAKIDVLQGN